MKNLGKNVKFKICGIKNENEAGEVAKLKIDFLGVIFAESKRQVSPQMAQKIAKIAHQNGKKAVGVFAEITKFKILEICDFVKLDAVQIYDNINFENELKNRNIELWQVVSIKNEIPNINNYKFDKILFDYKDKKIGGNGISWDFSLLENFKKNHPKINFIIAGGINVKNAKKAASYAPFALDINSSVENDAGIKEKGKILEILNLFKS